MYRDFLLKNQRQLQYLSDMIWHDMTHTSLSVASSYHERSKKSIADLFILNHWLDYFWYEIET